MSAIDTKMFLRDEQASAPYFEENLTDSGRGIPTIWTGARGLIYAALQAALKSSKFNIVACVDCARDVDPVAVMLPARFLLIIDESRTPELLADRAEIERLRDSYPGAIIAVLVGCHFTPTDIVAFRSANAIISQNASPEQLINILDIATDGVAILPMALPVTMPVLDGECPKPAISAEDASSQGLTLHRPLSDREVAILQHLSVGQSNKSIARTLSITESTVKIHVKGILRKLSAVNRTQAAIWALTNLKRPEQS